MVTCHSSKLGTVYPCKKIPWNLRIHPWRRLLSSTTPVVLGFYVDLCREVTPWNPGQWNSSVVIAKEFAARPHRPQDLRRRFHHATGLENFGDFFDAAGGCFRCGWFDLFFPLDKGESPDGNSCGFRGGWGTIWCPGFRLEAHPRLPVMGWWVWSTVKTMRCISIDHLHSLAIEL